jgi:1-deoxy-D-xylulose-5-phosphate reductoisomerase
MTYSPKVAILGSTGSIGKSTLDVMAFLPDRFQLAILSCHQNVAALHQQCQQFHPTQAFVTGPVTSEVQAWLQQTGNGTSRQLGMEALVQALREDSVDLVVAAIVGIAGLETALAAAETGKRLALANKEALVVAGELLLAAAQRSGAELIPIDSEHSAIFQALHSGRGKSEVRRLILTASGGPLRNWPVADLSQATVEDALSHPTWNMGRKITVDSATMMNKALEVIEARWLFDIPSEQIEVVIHPQSIIHSMVEFCDGSILAQLSPPDMRLPIQYALTYPHRMPSPAHRMDWSRSHQLDWCPVDRERYPALELGFEVARRGGTCGAVLNAANEAAVDSFLNHKIRLTEIASICRSVLEHHDYSPSPTLDELMRLDRWAREEVSRWMKTPC